MMRNNLLNFAEFERETISRETGFYQGGKVQFGYTPERRTINGKIGSVLVPSENAEAVRIAFQLKEIIEYFKENDIITLRTGRYKSKESISQMFVYIQKRVKEFHKTKSKLESKFWKNCRENKLIDNNPLKNWDSLTIEEKHCVR